MRDLSPSKEALLMTVRNEGASKAEKKVKTNEEVEKGYGGALNDNGLYNHCYVAKTGVV